MRIATWNLERPRPRSWKKLPRQRERMRAVDADIWVLTETRASIEPAAGFNGAHSPPHPRRRPDTDERWVSIWSRWPMRPTAVDGDPRGSISAVVETPKGEVVVYGTVIPWGNEPAEDGPAKMWSQHALAIDRQSAEWAELQRVHPGVPLIVAGDFNQSRDGSGWYGTRAVRDQLSQALAATGLTCVTEMDTVATGLLPDSHLVDHVCLPTSWLDDHQFEVSCLPKEDSDGVRLSDHPAVIVDITRSADGMPVSRSSRNRQAPSSTGSSVRPSKEER